MSATAAVSGTGTGDVYSMLKVSARFVNPQTESAYLKSLQDRLLIGISNCFFLLGTGLLVTLLLMFSDYTQIVGVPADVAKTERVASCLFAYMVSIAARVPGLSRIVGPRTCEILVIASLLLTLAGMFQTLTPGYKEAYAYLNASGRVDMETQIALLLDAIITCTHLMMPVRWCLMVWIDVVFVIGFSLHSYLALDNWHLNLILVFATLVAGSSCGLYMSEQTQRALFALVLDERTQKVHAQFVARNEVQGQLVGRERSDRQSSGGETASALSMPTTTDSHIFFREAAKSTDAEPHLLAMQEMAKSEYWIVKEDELRVDYKRKLGKSRLSVFEGSFCRSQVAVKIFKFGQNQIDHSLFTELGLLRHIRHPNIALFYGTTIDIANLDVKLVLEKIKGLKLGEYITEYPDIMGLLREAQGRAEFRQGCLTVVKGLCEALVYLHSRVPCIVHGDLKPDNIMVETPQVSPKAKLLDFGLSRTVTRNQRIAGGTPKYMAPEVKQAFSVGRLLRPSAEADVFSLGLILHFVATGSEVQRRRPPRVEDSGRSASDSPASDRPLPPDWEEIISACTSVQRENRPSMLAVHDALFDPSEGFAANSRSSTPSPKPQKGQDSLRL